MTIRSLSALFVCTIVGLLWACGGGGGSGKKPLVADTSGETPSESKDEDAGASAWSETNDGGAAAANAAILRGDEEGAQALLKQFLQQGADHAALTRSLRPTTSDYKTLFDGPTAAKVEAAQAKDWDSGKAVIKPKADQTEIKIWSASGGDLAAGKGNAKEFPGGYKKIGKHLAPAVLFFRFKFVGAGKDTGTAYDGLAFVNGHWVISPKPWRALEKGVAAGGDDEDEEPKPKPKPKGRGKKK